ncbi:hypothetical protein JG688_00008689 [Phytophthora aleatoria]|uniref:HAT C-terminal dimerisation domain-containing protein n=1 Tax=Phytophthora aleatoria TaxID=2496075 RepID=A0A8J5J7L9_9STRA|nr:hypothetical protein JG688_00008689 [Phytophthora aleatoria]
MLDQLKPNPKIVHSPVFESAVVKVINGSAMSNAEAVAVKRFEVSRCGSKRNASEEVYATQNLLAGPSKRAKNGGSVDDIAYGSLLKKLPPTSYVCERFFSQCKLVLIPQYTCMLPANFELLMFLRANRNMSDVTTLTSE